ncbi:MAG: hypothetical protein EA357_06350 [Micavibrio sp.]|nr:MAG: hypothetical protein EA357_06350 [Micavibrio sp.]
MAKETKINPKYVIRQTLPPVTFLTGLAVATAAGIGIHNGLSPEAIAPENTPTAMEESIIAQHQQNFSALEGMQAEIELLKSQTSLTGGSEELSSLQDAFNRDALSAYKDLYLNGTTSEGAGISETSFQELRTHFAENIVNPADLGFKSDVKAALLNETLAETDLRTGSDIERFQTVKEINEKLADAHLNHTNDKEMSALFTMVGALFTFIIIGVSGMGVYDSLRREPRHIRKPQKPGPYGKH